MVSQTVTWRDGDVAVLALAEIAPEFAGKRVILSYRRGRSAVAIRRTALVCRATAHGGRGVRRPRV
jgi:hypothetical protein